MNNRQIHMFPKSFRHFINIMIIKVNVEIGQKNNIWNGRRIIQEILKGLNTKIIVDCPIQRVVHTHVPKRRFSTLQKTYLTSKNKTSGIISTNNFSDSTVKFLQFSSSPPNWSWWAISQPSNGWQTKLSLTNKKRRTYYFYQAFSTS